MSTERKSSLVAAFNLLGGLGGIVSLAAIIFYGGAMAEQVKGLHVRVTVLEQNGSSSFKSHQTQDDERDSAQNVRLEKLEAAISKLGAMDQKLDRLLERKP